MVRPIGTKNPDYAATREALLRAVRERLLATDGAEASMRELARSAGVSVPTLRHYFPTRSGLIAAVLERDHAGALPFLHEIASGDLPPLQKSLERVLGYILAGLLESGLSDLHVLGLRAGLKDRDVGPAYLVSVLEPSLVALEARLERHVARGELREAPLRLAALQLLSPLLLAVLHQRELGGSRCRPLEVAALIRPHVEAFVRAWKPSARG